MTDLREHPPANASAAPEARALAATGSGRVVGLDGIRGLAALFVVLNHIFERAWPVPTGKSVVVYGLLGQDAFSQGHHGGFWAAGSPNRAFWSIAVEAQRYVLLPLLLLVRRVSARWWAWWPPSSWPWACWDPMSR